MKMKIRKGIVLAVKNKRSEFLLLRQKRSKSYSFISGGIENGETLKEAVVREAKEEVGLKINPEKLIETGKSIKFIGSKKGPAEQAVFFYDLEKRVELKPDNKEISGFEWVTKKEAIKKLNNKPPLIKIIKYLRPVDSAFAIICWQDKILLFLRDDNPTIPHPNRWQLPGGGIEKEETPQEALERELLEEVSYVPKDLRYLARVKRPAWFTHIFYSFVNDEEANKFKHAGQEGQKIGFFTLEEMEEINLTPALKERLKSNKKVLREALKSKSFLTKIF